MRLLTTEELAESWSMTPGVALSILEEMGVLPFPFGRGRGRGHRWDQAEAEAALVAWRDSKHKKAIKKPRRSASAESFFAGSYSQATDSMRTKQPRQ